MKIDFLNTDVDKKAPYISISECLNMLETPFDADTVAQKTYDKNFNNPESKYYQMTVEQIKESWEAKGADSVQYGSLLDDYIGVCLTGTENEKKLFKLNNSYDYDEKLRGLCMSYDNFANLMYASGDVEFVDREKTVYHKMKNPMHDVDNNQPEYVYVKGRFDALFYNKRLNKWIVIDWKSSGTIDKTPNKWTKKMLGPMFRYPQLNYYRYTTQLYFYKKTLIEDGYLPAGTKEEDVVIMIVNLPGKLIEETNTDYQTHKAAYQYDSLLMDNIFNFAFQKKFFSSN